MERPYLHHISLVYREAKKCDANTSKKSLLLTAWHPQGGWGELPEWVSILKTIRLWLVDQLADVCSESDMFPPGSPLPVSLRGWTRTQTNCKSCTIRGVDWEVVNARNQCKLNGVQVSELTDEETLKRVLQFLISSGLMTGCSWKWSRGFSRIPTLWNQWWQDVLMLLWSTLI